MRTMADKVNAMAYTIATEYESNVEVQERDAGVFVLTFSGGDQERQTFEANADRCGVPASIYDKCVTLRGRKFRIAGLKPKSRKNNIVIEDTKSRKRFVCSYDILEGVIS